MFPLEMSTSARVKQCTNLHQYKVLNRREKTLSVSFPRFLILLCLCFSLDRAQVYSHHGETDSTVQEPHYNSPSPIHNLMLDRFDAKMRENMFSFTSPNFITCHTTPHCTAVTGHAVALDECLISWRNTNGETHNPKGSYARFYRVPAPVLLQLPHSSQPCIMCKEALQ